MDIVKKIQTLQKIHPFIVLEDEPNSEGEYIFFSHIEDPRPGFSNYVFNVYIVKDIVSQEDLADLSLLLEKLLKLTSEYFSIRNMKPLKLGDFFVTYHFQIVINENFEEVYGDVLA